VGNVARMEGMGKIKINVKFTFSKEETTWKEQA
jgi:hypothetical protein